MVLNAHMKETISVPVPEPISDPSPQAMHSNPFVVLRGVAIGETVNNVPVHRKNGDRGNDMESWKLVSVGHVHQRVEIGVENSLRSVRVWV